MERFEIAAKFLRRHGWSLKAYLLAVVTLPPVALIIAWKNPSAPLRWRILGLIPPILMIVIPLLGGGAFIAKIVVRAVR
jgi:hypothetical protein